MGNILSVFAAAGIAALVTRLLSDGRRTEHPHATSHPAPLPVVQRLVEAIVMCILSYTDAYIGTHLMAQGGWELQGTSTEGSLWLWKKQAGASAGPRWALVVRGTRHLHDLGEDGRLFADSVDSDRDGWTADADRMLGYARELLQTHGVTGPVLFSGHSLGASYAEYFQHALQAQHPGSPAITFDSPGQPTQFRQAKGMLLRQPGLTTLNAMPNVVNTLNTPCAEQFFTCTHGATLALSYVATVAGTLATGLPLKMLVGLGFGRLQRNTDKHRLESMQEPLRMHRIRHAQPDMWPTYTKTVAQSVFGLANALCTGIWAGRDGSVHTGGPVPDPPTPGSTPASTPQAVPAPPPPANIAELPLSLDALALRTAYYIPSLARWEAFQKLLSAHDVVFALAGMTGQGKTSILIALLGQLDDTLLQVGDGANTTLYPHVVWVKMRGLGRVYIVDLPGGGAAGQVGTGTGTLIMNDAAKLLDRIVASVGTVFFVQKDSHVTDDQRAYFHRIEQHPNIRTRLIYNENTLLASHVDKAKAAVVKAFSTVTRDGQPRLDQALKRRILGSMVTTRIIARPDLDAEARSAARHDDTKLLAMWKEETREPVPDDPSPSPPSVGQQRAKAQRRTVDFAPDIGEVITAGLSTVGVWFPGMAAWTAWGMAGAEIVVIGGVGTIAVGPAVAAIGATGTVYGVRRAWSAWKAWKK